MQLDPAVINFAIGAAAGAVSAVTVFPIEYAKTKMQNARESEEKERYSSTLTTMMSVVRENGLFALWSGVLPVVLGSAPEAAIKLATHSFLIASMASAASAAGEGGLPMPYQILAGAFSGVTTVVATNPMEVLRLKASRNDGSSMWENIRELGIGGLFTGCSATWLRDIPFNALYFPMYASMKELSLEDFGALPWQAALVAGMASGFMASFLTTPCDVIKTRVQSRPSVAEEPFFSPSSAFPRQIVYFAARQGDPCSDLRRTAKSMLDNEGWSSFFAGAGARVGKLGPEMAITLVVYEVLQQALHVH